MLSDELLLPPDSVQPAVPMEETSFGTKSAWWRSVVVLNTFVAKDDANAAVNQQDATRRQIFQ
jgi:hypothetical protein